MRNFGLILLVACSAEKPEVASPDYGPEDAKFDSAKAPASSVDVAIGDVATASFTQKSQYRAFRFDGKKGQKVTVYVDGLKGLDTILSLYKVSPSTHKPYGSALATNDDTNEDGWTVKTNTRHNPYSSSIVDFTLAATRSYAVVATTYDGSTGKAEVVVKSQDVAQKCSGLIAYPACPSDMYCALPDGVCGGADLPGYCKPRPEVCIEIYQPVCGCDGRTYGNDCQRQGNGAQLDHVGPCALTSQQIDDAARDHVYGSAAGQTIFASETAAEKADQSHPIDGYWLARDGANFVSGIHDLWAERFSVDVVSGEITTTGEH